MGLFDRLRGDDDPRVAFFGIDGVPFSLLSEHSEEFQHLSALAEEGAAGPIDSIVPPESSACWPSLTTGKNPGETGVYGFQDREVGSYDTYVPMGRDVQADRLWDRVQADGRDATVMNVPVTFPPQRNVQRMVSGFLSPSVDKAAYPDTFRDRLNELDYPIDVDSGLGHEDKREFLRNAHETLDKRHEAFKRYVEADDWDLFFGVFMTTDRVNHFLFRDYEEGTELGSEFLEFYRKLDRYLGELRELLPEDVTMIVASDHGFTSLDYEVNCNAWLREQGWLSFDDGADYVLQLNAWLDDRGIFTRDHTDYVFQIDAWLREETNHVVGDVDEDGLDAAAVDAHVDDGTVVAVGEATKDDLVRRLERVSPRSLREAETDGTRLIERVDAEPVGPAADDAGTTEERADGSGAGNEAEPDDGDAGQREFRITVEPADGVELAVDSGTEPLSYVLDESVEDGAYVDPSDPSVIVARTEAARDDVLADLEDLTPASLADADGDETALVAGASVEEREDGYRIVVEPGESVRLAGALDPGASPLEYTHSELGDLGDGTRAYSLIPGRFYVNLEGREPRGSVPESEYEAVRAELKEDLENMEGPNGEPVAGRVVETETAFRGEHDDIAPDLVIVPNHGFDLKSGFKGRKDPFVEFRARNGMHSFDDATLLIDDPDATIDDADLYDIAPTILELMDVDYDRASFDGASLI